MKPAMTANDTTSQADHDALAKAFDVPAPDMPPEVPQGYALFRFKLLAACEAYRKKNRIKRELNRKERRMIESKVRRGK